ncbi:N-acetyltransferase [Sporosarcina sp. Te-1]|uniref:GNAT family N-acetyltransferase n=1 Tax=Sporosarcina sp. Te-1 TaxID=2818390 RepID=UPI001A9F9322|nr:GNAT family N-acetyltransferase [Sporosarcina sp. Te-1]QTD41907.1 GNAT family N-acetyltransferase [Sporosarcina sp. Te-1]
MNYQIETILKQDEAFAAFLRTKIREYNNERSVHHAKAREEGSVLPIFLIATDENHEWIGGIAAEVYWNWLEINHFWVHERYRGQGLGRQLIEKTENIAIEKGAEKALVTTFEFQARSYYEEKGYEVVGEIKDYPPGCSYYTMVKKLGVVGL